MHFKKDSSIVVSANDNIIEPWPIPQLFLDHMMSLQHLFESDSVRVAETGLHLMLLLLLPLLLLFGILIYIISS